MMNRRHRSQGFPALVCAALLALAACAPEGQAPEASSDATPSTAETTTQTSSSRVGLRNCATPDGGKVHFSVGGTVLALNPGEIQETIPASLKPPFTAEVLKAELDRQTAQGGGCPEKPLDMLVLAMNVPNSGTLLQGTIGLLATDPSRLSRGYAEITTRLQSETPENCSKLGGDLLACIGTETNGNRRAEVMYMVTTDRSKKMNSGGPLAIRCAMQQGNLRGCNLIDQGRSNYIIDAILDDGEYSTASIERAWRAALSEVDARRK